MLDYRETNFLEGLAFLVWFVPGSGQRFEVVDFTAADEIGSYIVRNYHHTLKVRVVHTERYHEGEGVQ